MNQRLGAGNLRRRPATRQQDQRPGPQQGVSDEAAGRLRQGRMTEDQEQESTGTTDRESGPGREEVASVITTHTTL